MQATVVPPAGFDFARSGHLLGAVAIARFGYVLEQAGAHSLRRGCRPRRDVELAEDVGDVAMNGVLAHHEPLGDLPVRARLSRAGSAPLAPAPSPAADVIAPRRQRRTQRGVAAPARPRARPPAREAMPAPSRPRSRPPRRVPAPTRLVAASSTSPAGGLERRAASLEAIECILQQPPRPFVISPRRHQHALGQVGATPGSARCPPDARPRATPSGPTAASSSSRRAIRALDQGLLESREAIQPPVGGHLTQQPL